MILRRYMQKISAYLSAGMLLGIAFFLLFFNLAEDMLEQQLVYFDQSITSVVTSIGSPAITEIMKRLTTMGSGLVLTGIAILVIIGLVQSKKLYREAGMLAVALGGSALMNYILKLAFHRTRPSLPSLVQASGYSFPSGHAMSAFVFYGMLAYLLWVKAQRNPIDYILCFLMILLIIGIGVSRIYLGVHYPSDVLAGFAAGGIWLVGCIMALQTIKTRPKKVK